MLDRLRDGVVGFVFRLVAHALFRVRIEGVEQIPSRGPALLVANHLTYLDAFLIGSCLKPVVRFLVWKPYYEHPVLNPGFRLARSIPVCTRPRGAAEGIWRARAELRRGEIVCIFAEGAISRTGRLQEFKRGLEGIARDLEIPIVPVYLSGLWESVFSCKRGRFFWKHTRHLRHPVAILFGPPMPPSSAAHEVQRAMEKLARE
jgi:acyl-[acyl-carrier-protein]-phospholipid O-acyltransferase/long-chain-fatty-acid--[acyl-carrier-protein] ligase